MFAMNDEEYTNFCVIENYYTDIIKAHDRREFEISIWARFWTLNQTNRTSYRHLKNKIDRRWYFPKEHSAG